MKDAVLCCAIIFCSFLSVIAIIFFTPTHETIIYSCAISEISADFPIKARDECRRKNDR